MSTMKRTLWIVPLALGLACAGSRQPVGTKQTPSAVREGVAQLSDPLHACYEQHGKGGYVQAKLTIEQDGHVSAVELDEKWTGTPAGNCVRQVVLTQGRFAVDHGPIIIRYPLLLK